MTSKTQEHIRERFERNAELLSIRPRRGQGTTVTRVTLTDGLACSIEEGPWTMSTDMGKDSGGKATAPTPGVLGRAALGSCLASGYAMWAAKLGVSIDHLEVEIETDYDLRGMYGIDDVSPGPVQLRYTVRVKSEAPEEEILRVLDEADAHSPEMSFRLSPHNADRTVEIMDEHAAKTA